MGIIRKVATIWVRLSVQLMYLKKATCDAKPAMPLGEAATRPA